MGGRLERLFGRSETQEPQTPQDRSAEYERRLPGFKEKMTDSREKLIAGDGVVFVGTTIVPRQEYMAQFEASTDEHVLVDNS